jgi:metal-responsive CopG/Arc/MetJ family transcriptional regulator
MKNRALKISVSIPIRTVEELDKLTTYKGLSRSRWITKTIQTRLDGGIAVDEQTELQMIARLHANTKDPLLKVILWHYLQRD